MPAKPMIRLLLGAALAAMLPASSWAQEDALAEARRAADADRNAEAVASYRGALEQAGEDRPD